MIECEFCHNSKSQRYVYTQCDHFVCINCAALRAGESLMCCNRRTALDSQVIAELAEKKLSIINNLQNQYQYEKKDKDNISFDEIERKLSMINIEDGKKTKRPVTQPVITVNENNLMNVGNDDEIFIDNSQDNHKVFQRSSRDANAYYNVQTPIRMIQNPSAIIQVQSDNGGSSQLYRSVSSNKPSQFKSQLVKMKQSPFSLQECKPMLEAQLDFIKLQFQTLHQALRRIQDEIVINLKVYFEEYVKLIQNDYDLGAISEENVVEEKERIKAYLEAVVQQSKVQEIKVVVLGGEGLKMNGGQLEKKVVEKNNAGGPSIHEQRLFQNQKKVVFNKTTDNQTFPLPLQSRRAENLEPRNRHQGSSNSKPQQSSDSFFQKLHLNTMREHFHNVQIQSIAPAASTNRNLDKIYRKLQESRSKLEQRIQLHSEFVNKRTTKMSNM